jgi:Ca2+-binding RTX toxin-like protein
VDGSFLPNSGDDTLNGGNGNDGLWGFDGNDVINAPEAIVRLALESGHSARPNSRFGP